MGVWLGSARPYRRSADIVRVSVGLIWIAGAAFNAVWTLRHTDLYQGFVDDAPLPAVRWFFGEVVMAHPAIWTVLLIIGELALGILTLGKGAWARLGIAGGAAWSAVLFILLPPYTLMMGPFALAIAWLLRWDYPHSALHLFRRHRSETAAVKGGAIEA
jgi:hypothetical protein